MPCIWYHMISSSSVNINNFPLDSIFSFIFEPTAAPFRPNKSANIGPPFPKTQTLLLHPLSRFYPPNSFGSQPNILNFLLVQYWTKKLIVINSTLNVRLGSAHCHLSPPLLRAMPHFCLSYCSQADSIAAVPPHNTSTATMYLYLKK